MTSVQFEKKATQELPGFHCFPFPIYCSCLFCLDMSLRIGCSDLYDTWHMWYSHPSHKMHTSTVAIVQSTLPCISRQNLLPMLLWMQLAETPPCICCTYHLSNVATIFSATQVAAQWSLWFNMAPIYYFTVFFKTSHQWFLSYIFMINILRPIVLAEIGGLKIQGMLY